MSTPREEYERVAGRFDEVVRGVPAGRWDDPAPCEGWVARDVVRHLVEWVPALFGAAGGVEVPEGPSVDDDPVGAWTVLRDAFRRLLAEPGVHERRFEHERAGSHALDDAVSMFFTGDLLVHAWDIAAATGQDRDVIPGDEAAAALAEMEPIDQLLRDSGQYGPKVDVDQGAPALDRLIAFTGRDPGFGLSRP